MPKHLERELENLKRRILSLGAKVEERLRMAIKALETRDGNLANQVIQSDHEIDEIEVDIEEECLKVLALHQPVAIDLRFIISVIKINNDLERIGDLAVNIAERAAFLATQRKLDILFDFPGMAEKAQSMVKKSLDALVNLDSRLAWEVFASDDEVDAMNRDMFIQVQNGIRKNINWMECLIHVLSASRYLERVADSATNIAEDVVYMIEGEIVRHRPETFQALVRKDSEK
jgi:phosphate transport system protein